MKTRLLLITIFFTIGAIIIYIITEPKIETWTYELPNNYVIKKITEDNVVLGKYIDNIFTTKISEQKIEEYIAEFSYSENYISLKCAEVNEQDIYVRFYIIDTKKDNIYGPYDYEETYKEEVSKIVNEQLSDWIKTIVTPKDAKINNRGN